MAKARSYGEDWDEYVRHWRTYVKGEPRSVTPESLAYPGDEWGRPEEWEALAERYLLPYVPPGGMAVELGQGSGKYTLHVLRNAARVVCFDVSRKFIGIAGERLAEARESGAVDFEHLEMRDCYEIRDALKARGLLGRIDLFFSVDAMVHVELHTLAAYFVNASLALSDGGHLVMTLATATTGLGFDRLMAETGWSYGGMRPSHQFYFVSPELVRFVLEGLGFEILALDQPSRDLTVVARKSRTTDVTLTPAPD
jgi:SAM-dependent methyltransferase